MMQTKAWNEIKMVLMAVIVVTIPAGVTMVTTTNDMMTLGRGIVVIIVGFVAIWLYRSMVPPDEPEPSESPPAAAILPPHGDSPAAAGDDPKPGDPA